MPVAPASTAIPPHAPYSLRQIEQMLGLARRVITGLIAAGFVVPQRGPRNAYRFSFQDVVLLRTAHQLSEAKIAPRRLMRSLKQLKAKLPDEIPLSGLRIKVIGNDVAVRDANAQWEASSGQLLMDFELAPPGGGNKATIQSLPVDAGAASYPPDGKAVGAPVGAASAAIPPDASPSIAAEAAPTKRKSATAQGLLSAAPVGAPVGAASAAIPPDASPSIAAEAAPTNATHAAAAQYDLALQHEATNNPAAAEEAYRKLLKIAPVHVDAAINLSAMLCDAGRCADALDICDQLIASLGSDETTALLHFNRAIALEDQQRVDEALQAYERSLQLDPHLADAHYNAARLYEQTGHAKDALRHFSAYRRMQKKR